MTGKTEGNNAEHEPNTIYRSSIIGNVSETKEEAHSGLEDRAVYRDFAKLRREAFSENLMELTELLPTLKSEPRLSKYAIVDAGLLWNQHQMISTATHPSDPSGDMVPRMLLTILRTSGPKKQRF
ncbi:hypothetical protein PENANT_c001G11706 [Penicillium antarcticum]|uniref:BHLH domain-containing protein n=1 Tax=Penicillium antarcticum TaxID=416450 RepID=A0A1V6QN93_9EURO|nr:hypothetical protein PENANT_c001G11706 [Penicillium antarcticum]